MEKPAKGGKPKADEAKKIIRKKRGPLQDLNGHPICKTARRERSNPSSLAASVSFEAPKGCLRMFLSSNSRSSSSSSSKPVIEKSSKPLLKLGVNNPSKLAPPKPKEIEPSRKPMLQKSNRIHPQGVRKDTTKPVAKNGQRSKPSSNRIDPVNKLKKEVQAKPASSSFHGNCAGKSLFDRHRLPNLNSSGENSTPLGKLSSLSSLDPKNSIPCKPVAENSINEASSSSSVSDVKTPPVEASLSPQIHRQSNSKILVLNSAATPVCYGAGHLVSGVTDNRKCRRRGSLRGGYERTNLFNKETSAEESTESLILLPGEAYVRWALSPCQEGREEHGGDSPVRLSQRRIICDDDLSLPSPSLSGNTPDLLCDLCSSGDLELCKVRTKNDVESIRKATEFKGVFRALDDVNESLLASSPARNSLALSVGSLGSQNIIQTPDSDGHHEINCSNFFASEPSSLAESLCRLKLSSSPRNEVLEWDASESVLDSMTLSQMKVSWRDELVATNVQTDEFDCCCLSDEEIHGDDKSTPVENEENGLEIDMDISPIASEYEPCVLVRGKENLLPRAPDVCAESICTDADGLVASGYSDWTYSLDKTFLRSNDRLL